MGDEPEKIFNIDPNHIGSSTPRLAEEGKQVDELARSFAMHGCLQPIRVRDLGNGEYECRSGERRLAAAKKAGLKAIPCILTDSDSILLSLVENIERVELDPVEKAQAYNRGVEEMGGVQKAFSEKIQKSVSSVCATLSLLKLHPTIIEKHLQDGILCESRLLKIPPQGSLAEQQQAYDRLVNLKRSKKLKRNATALSAIRKKVDLLANAIMRLDPQKTTSTELAEIFVCLLSAMELIVSCLTRMPLVDPAAVEDITKSGAFSLKQAIERLDLSSMNENDLNIVFGWVVEILKRLVDGHPGKIVINPSVVAAAMRHLCLDLASQCQDKQTLDAFSVAVSEIELAIRKYRARKFSALNFWQRIARWMA